MSPDEHPAAISDRRRLRAVELALAVVVSCIAVAAGHVATWPLIAWPMYARGYPAPPDQVSDVRLRLLGRDGVTTTVTAPAVFGHVETALGREVIARAFQQRPDRAAYRDVLLLRLRPLLAARDVAEIQGWKLTWEVHPLDLPPFDLDDPMAEELLGRIEPGPAAEGAERARGAAR